MIKRAVSKDYNYIFDDRTGEFARWGKTKNDDPQMSPFGPEILDIEVSTICNGIQNKPCSHCYKSNTSHGKNMSFSTFKTILDKIPENLTQVAFGIGDIDSNPDLFKMMSYCRHKKVVPNITINGAYLTDTHISFLRDVAGAVAVSRYTPPDVCYNAVERLTDAGMTQINIHMLVSNETLDDCYQVIADSQNDSRLVKLNAIVFLHLKPKGRRNKHSMVSDEDYEKLIRYSLKNKASIGFDSCSAHKFLKAIGDSAEHQHMKDFVEPCESGCFSSYINVDGKYLHCSFTEGLEGYDGIDVVNCNNFLKDVWYGEETVAFRDKLLQVNRKCPLYPLDG